MTIRLLIPLLLLPFLVFIILWEPIPRQEVWEHKPLIALVFMDRPWPRYWDAGPGYHTFRDPDSNPWVVVHGVPERNLVSVAGRDVHPSHLVQLLLREGNVVRGEKLRIVCCHPGLKIPGEVLGVSYSFVGRQRGVTYLTWGTPGILEVSAGP